MGRCEAVEAAITGLSGCRLRVAAGVGSGKRRSGASRDSPDSREARLGLTRPLPLSQKRLPASLSRRKDPNASANAARLVTLRRRHFTYRPRREAGLLPQPGSDADAEAKRARPLAISREGAWQEQSRLPSPALSALPLCAPHPREALGV